MKVRDQATDRSGLPLAPGLLVRLVGAAGQPEARIVRVLGDYDSVTIVVEDRAGKREQMVPCTEIEVLAPARETRRLRRDVA